MHVCYSRLYLTRVVEVGRNGWAEGGESKPLADENTVPTVCLIAAVDIALFVSSLDVTPCCPCGYQLMAGDGSRRCGVEIEQCR